MGRDRRRDRMTVDQELRRGYEVADPVGSDPADPPRSATLFHGATAAPDDTSGADSREADRRARNAVRRRPSEDRSPEKEKAWADGSEPWDLPLPESPGG